MAINGSWSESINSTDIKGTCETFEQCDFHASKVISQKQKRIANSKHYIEWLNLNKSEYECNRYGPHPIDRIQSVHRRKILTMFRGDPRSDNRGHFKHRCSVMPPLEIKDINSIYYTRVDKIASDWFGSGFQRLFSTLSQTLRNWVIMKDNRRDWGNIVLES